MSRKIKKNSFKIVLPFFALLLQFAFSASCQNSQLADAIKKEFDTLKYFAKQPATQLEFDYKTNSSSESKPQSGKIIFNINQFERIINKIGKKYQTDLIRLIVSHELAHQIQYVFYHNISDEVLAECQADIIAGFLLFQDLAKEYFAWIEQHSVSQNSDPNNLKRLNELKEQIYAALTAIFNAGQDYAIENDHPASEQRQIAVRDGLAYGNIWLYGEILNNPNNPGNPDPYNRNNKDIENFYKKVLNYLPQDNLLTWSIRHAKKILHNSLQNCKDIVVYTDWKWNEKPSNPYLYFTQKITNIGKKTLSISFYNQVCTVLRSDPKNTLYWDLRATNPYFITLHQNETKNITDSIRWVASAELMPRFIYFGDLGSLYDCSSITDNNPEIFNSKSFYEGNNVPEDVLLDKIISTRSDFIKFIAGVGTTYNINSFDDIYYRSKIQIPSGQETNIHYSKEHKSYTCEVDYYNGDSKNNADGIIKRLITNLEKSGNKVIKKNSATDENSWTIYNDNNEITGEITLTAFRSKNYSVDLVIFAK